MVLLHFAPLQFLQLGLELVGFTAERQGINRDETKQRWFRSSFACCPATCTAIFDDLQVTIINEARVDNPNEVHFLMATHWLASHKVESQLAGQFDLNETTVRTHVWRCTVVMQALKEDKIVWPNLQLHQEIFVFTVDTVHCSVFEPRTDPDSRWRSPKTNGPAKSCELAVFIPELRLIWISEEDHKGGNHDHDICIEPNGLKSLIPEGKKGVADRGCDRELNQARVTLAIRNRLDTPEVKAFKRRVRARHENFNARIKLFDVLSQKFRHDVPKHRIVFEAVCVIVQHDIENHPSFDAQAVLQNCNVSKTPAAKRK